MEPGVLEQRYLAKRRSGRRWAAIAVASSLVLLGLLISPLVGGGPNLGLIPLEILAIGAGLKAIIDLSDARDAKLARNYR
jgi:hypothetical protein